MSWKPETPHNFSKMQDTAQEEWDRFCAQQKRMWEEWKKEMVDEEDATQEVSDI